MTKSIIQFDQDENFSRFLFHAFRTMGSSVRYLGTSTNLNDVMQYRSETGACADIYLLSLNSHDLDVQTIVGSVRNVAPDATIIGFLNKDDSSVRNVARQFGCDDVFVKHQNFQEMASSVVQVASTKLAYAPYTSDFDVPTLKPVQDELLGVKNQNSNGFEPFSMVVGSAKGGVGKTTISVELASAFANVKRSNSDRKLKVCLVDMDLEKPDVPVALNITVKPFTIFNWYQDIEARKKITPMNELHYGFHEVERWLAKTDNGLYVLLGPNTPMQASSIDHETIKFMIDELKTMFDVVIIDVGNNKKDYTIISYMSCDKILSVFSLDNACLRDNYADLKTLKELDVPSEKFLAVINRAHSNAGITVKEVENFITEKMNIKFLGAIPKNDMVEKARNNSEILILTKNNEFTTNLKKVGNQIMPVFAKNLKNAKNSSNKKGNSNKSMKTSGLEVKQKRESRGFFLKLFVK